MTLTEPSATSFTPSQAGPSTAAAPPAAPAPSTKKPAGRRVGSGDLRRTVRLFRRFMGNPRVYLVGVVLLVLEAGTAVVEPYPIAYLVDYLQGAKPTLRDVGAPALLSSERLETILLLTLAIVAIAAINSAADSLTEVCMARGGRSLGYGVRTAMYSHLQRLPLAYHDKKRTGDVLTRVTGDVLVVEDFIVKSVSNILGSLLVLVGSFAFLLYQSWNVALVAVVVIPGLAVVSNHFSRRIKVVSKTQRDREGDLASTAQEMLTSIRLVQSYGRGTVDLQRFSTQTERSMHASVGGANIQAQFSFVIALVEALAISAVIWLGVWLLDRDAITIGTLVLFVLLLQNMFKPARKIVSEWYKIGKVFASVERIEDLLDREVVVSDLPYAVPAPQLSGRLTFQHVSFAYPAEHEDGSSAAKTPLVLDDIDFEVEPGEVVSLVGFSGAGKSTIAQLVPRLYDPDEGAVLVDGLPLRGLTLASLRGQVSLVLQDTVLLSGSVAENIGYGVENASLADIEAAAKLANAHDFIMAMPAGYATQLGERGSTLSGGQRQRLAIARAFIRQAPILVLDEPTTGLDAESAQVVVGALRGLMRGKTTIVISHDLGLIRCADRVLVIAGGRIVESGPHDLLMRTGGPYAELHSKQFELDSGADGASREGLGGAREPGWSGGRAARKPRSGLVHGLRRQLPGLAMAMDESFVADRVEQVMLSGNTTVDGILVGKLWLRADQTCSLRYQLRLSDGHLAATEHSVLGRVHADDEAAAAYVTRSVHRLLDRGGTPPPPPWRKQTTVAADAGLALHPFPIDPTLPTLPGAMDPAVVWRLATYSGMHEPGRVEVVHHPREGACVLRYHLHGGEPSDHPRATLYGKLYGDDHGDVVDGFLRGLAREQVECGGRQPAQFPMPVVYVPSLRLLVTEALPGTPLVPRLLEAVLAVEPDDGSTAEQVVASRAELAAAVRASGHALAALHGSGQRHLATAPLHFASDELASLQRQADLVGEVWPDPADKVHRGVAPLLGADLDPATVVLSHGDFTPSQVLLNGGAPAVVDLDTLCWADPALDLGRFLAQLELLAVKRGGEAALPLVDQLSQEFLRGYREATTYEGDTVGAAHRIAFYQATTLARSALHSCRQLKEHRLRVALSLLDSLHARSRRVEP